MEKVLNVLGVIECGGGSGVSGGLALVARLSWVDT